MIPENVKLEPCPFCGDRMQNRRGLVMHHDLDRPKCIIGDNSFSIEWAERWNTRASRLTRQEDEIRTAALEEADNRTAAVEAFRAWFFQHTGKRIFHTNAGKAVDVVIRALKEAGQ